MKDKQKQYFFGFLCVFAVVVMSFCIFRMIPLGMSGEMTAVRGYFIILSVALVLGLFSGVLYYFYRGRSTLHDKDLERMQIEADILAHVGEKASKPRNPGKRN